MVSKLLNYIYGTALFLILIAATAADGLADIHGGFAILFGIVIGAGALVDIGNRLERREAARREERRKYRDRERKTAGH